MVSKDIVVVWGSLGNTSSDGDFFCCRCICDSNVDDTIFKEVDGLGSVRCVPFYRKRLLVMIEAIIDEGISKDCMKSSLYQLLCICGC